MLTLTLMPLRLRRDASRSARVLRRIEALREDAVAGVALPVTVFRRPTRRVLRSLFATNEVRLAA